MINDDYLNRLKSIFEELNIPEEYFRTAKTPLCEEAQNLAEIGEDVFGRKQRLLKSVAVLWSQMKSAAQQDGVDIDVVSAFRSIDYQKQLIQRKLEKGIVIDEILKVNTPPGFSEHHTGRALDITTKGCEPLSEAFEKTEAFQWLIKNAARFNFSLSYPRDNPYGIIYEPWHWAASEK